MIRQDEIVDSADYIFIKDDVMVVVDDITMDFVNMSTLDYKVEMIRSSFEILANPNAELACSCGTSFQPKNM